MSECTTGAFLDKPVTQKMATYAGRRHKRPKVTAGGSKQQQAKFLGKKGSASSPQAAHNSSQPSIKKFIVPITKSAGSKRSTRKLDANAVVANPDVQEFSCSPEDDVMKALPSSTGTICVDVEAILRERRMRSEQQQRLKDLQSSATSESLQSDVALTPETSPTKAEMNCAVENLEVRNEGWPGLVVFPAPASRLAFPADSIESILYANLTSVNSNSIQYVDDHNAQFDDDDLLIAVLSVLLAAGADANVLGISTLPKRKVLITAAQKRFTVPSEFAVTDSAPVTISVPNFLNALPLLSDLSWKHAIWYWSIFCALGLDQRIMYNVEFNDAVTSCINNVISAVRDADWPAFVDQVTVVECDWLQYWPFQNVMRVCKWLYAFTDRGRIVQQAIAGAFLLHFGSKDAAYVSSVSMNEAQRVTQFMKLIITAEMLQNDERLIEELILALSILLDEQMLEQASIEDVQLLDAEINQALKLISLIHLSILQTTQLKQQFTVLKFHIGRRLHSSPEQSSLSSAILE